MSNLFLYPLALFLGWLLSEALIRNQLFKSHGAAISFCIGVMLVLVRLTEWQLESPLIDGRSGEEILFADYILINAFVVSICLATAFFLELRRRRQ